MSYCVNCGVELDPSAGICPLCHTPVVNPGRPADEEAPPPFPTRRAEVQPVNKWEVALLLSAMLASVAVCCGLLNLFFLRSDRPWSLYVIGAAVMLWIWLVPPLLHRTMPLWLRLLLDVAAVGTYVYLISIDLRGHDWYMGLALPIILTGGAIMAALGLLVTTIGIDPQQGVYRLTFGSDILVRGVDLVPALIGLFAVSELFSQAEKKILRLSQPPQVKMDKAHGWKDMLKFKWLMLKSSIIGVIVGACPGTGAAIAAFLSYGEAKRGSKHPEEFGNGSEEGLCAAETANNAVTGATLIPMLTLGIPGDSVTAVLMGALTIQGLTPGTELFVKHADMTYVVLVGFIIVQILMFYMGKLAIRGFSQITKIPYYILLPMVMAFCMVGSYSCSNNMTDILIAILFGLIGYIMPKFGFPTTPMLIGIVLGSLAEKNLVRTMAVYAGDVSVFFTRPISLLFLALSVVSVAFALLQKHRDKKKA